jgi:hypothetical protein
VVRSSIKSGTGLRKRHLGEIRCRWMWEDVCTYLRASKVQWPLVAVILAIKLDLIISSENEVDDEESKKNERSDGRKKDLCC